jgi:hypothetical protein
MSSRISQALMVIVSALAFVLACSSNDDIVSGNGKGDTVDLMVINASPDAPGVDVLLDNQEFIQDLAYPSTTNYAIVSAGMHSVQVRQRGSTNPVVANKDIQIDGLAATILVTGSWPGVSLDLLPDDLTRPDTNYVKIRVVNLSPDLGPVDVTMLAPAPDTAFVAGVDYMGSTGFKMIGDDAYGVSVYEPGTNNVVLNVDALQLEGGGIYTEYIVGFEGGVGNEGLQLELVDNTLP